MFTVEYYVKSHIVHLTENHTKQMYHLAQIDSLRHSKDYKKFQGLVINNIKLKNVILLLCHRCNLYIICMDNFTEKLNFLFLFVVF